MSTDERTPEADTATESQIMAARLAAIVANSDDVILSKTLEGIITSWNGGAERIFGYSAEEMIGQHISTIIPHELMNEEKEIIARLTRGERIEHFETVRVAKDGIDTEVARLGPGSFFGEMSLMTGEPRSATVAALANVQCYRLDATAFRDLLARRPQLAEPIARLLAERRANLAAVTEGLDAEAKRRRMESDSSDLFKKMKAFFKL